jgi:hypothetical protein
VRTFSRLFERFVDDFDAATTSWLGEQTSGPPSARSGTEDDCDPADLPAATSSDTPAPATQRTPR